MPEIVFEDVTLGFNGSVVSDVSFHIKESNHACIYGPVGAGKSVLLRSLAGQAQIKKGSALFFENGAPLDTYDFYRLGHLMEFSKASKYFNPAHHFYQQRYHAQLEDDEFSKSLTISDLLQLKEMSMTNRHVRASLQRANLFDHLETKLIQLSNGQRKKLQLLLSLQNNSRILLLDAPYLGLDVESRHDLNNWLYDMAQQKKVQIIMVADERDMPNWITCRIQLPNANKKSSRLSLSQFLNRQSASHLSGINSSTAKIVELNKLTLSLNGQQLFKNVSWSMRAGERIALIGGNGSGKSTLMSFLYADNPKAYSTRLRMFGVQRGKGDSIWEVKRKIGFTSSELQIYFTESITCKKAIATGFFDTKFVPGKLSEQQEETIHGFADYFDVVPLLSKNYQQISYGEQRLILFIRSLVKIPQLLLLDEPYQGFDPPLIHRSNKLLDALVKRFNMAMLFISHHEDELPASIDRKLMLYAGKLEEV